MCWDSRNDEKDLQRRGGGQSIQAMHGTINSRYGNLKHFGFMRSMESLICQELKPGKRLKYLPAMRETWVRSLGWEDSLEKEMAIRYSILA